MLQPHNGVDVLTVEYDRCDWHLANWAQWMRSPGFRLWFSSKASGGMGNSGSSEFDSMVASADTRCAVAVDAILDGLPVPERLAVYHVHLACVWRLRHDIDAMYAAAKGHVTQGLTQRGIW